MADVKWSDNTAFPIHISILDADYFVGLSGGLNTKWTALTLVDYVSPLVTIAVDQISDLSLQNTYEVSDSPQITGDMLFAGSVPSTFEINGALITATGNVDLGAGGIVSKYAIYGNPPGGLTEAIEWDAGFINETIGAESGFSQWQLMNNGSLALLFHIRGQDSTYQARAGFGAVTNLSVGLFPTDAINTHAILEAHSTTKGFLPPVLTATQESTLVGSLASGDKGLYWYNSTVNVPVFWDGLDRQQILAIDNVIQGTNMTITNNGDGTVTFASGGSSGTTQQVSGAFTVYQNATSTTPSTSSFQAIAIDATKFTAVRQNGTSVTTATINSATTPIIQNTSTGGTRYCTVTFDISINPSFAAGQLYTFGIVIQRNGGGLVQTNFQTNFAQPTIATAASFKPISISGLVDLGTNDYVYLTVLSNTASQSFVTYNFNAELIDTTVASIPSTDALTQGTNNRYLTQDGGTTYEYMSGSATVGNLPQFNSTGGQLIDSGITVSLIQTSSAYTYTFSGGL